MRNPIAIPIILLLLSDLLALGCDASNPWPNSKRYRHVEDAILLKTDANVANAVAFSPSDAIALDSSHVLYLDSATRKLMELDLDDSSQRALFDFSRIENDLNPARHFDDTWGLSLIRANDAYVVISGPKRPMIWANLQTGTYTIVGQCDLPNAQIPQTGTRLSSVDFNLFNGIGRTDEGFVLAFGSQIFKLPWNGESPDLTQNFQITLIAGAIETSADTPDPLDALKANLMLDDFTQFVEHEGWLFFWESPKLRALRDGRLITVTGDGYSTPECELDEFYAYALPTYPKIVVQNGHLFTPYWKNSMILQIDLDSIDAQTGEVAGSLALVMPSAQTLSGITPIDDDLLSFDSQAGSFWRIDLENESATRLFGPESEDARLDDIAQNPDSIYNISSILKPLALQTLLDGKAALVHAPTLNTLYFLSLDSLKSTLFWTNPIQHIAAEGHNAWLANHSMLYLLDFSNLQDANYAYVSRFFQNNNAMGIPCDRKTLRLTENVQLQMMRDQLIVYAPETPMIFSIPLQDGDITSIHANGWITPGDDSVFYNTGLAIDAMTQWAAGGYAEYFVQKNKGHQWLGVANPSSRAIEIADLSIEPSHAQYLSSSENTPIADGNLVTSCTADDLVAIAADSDGTLYVATNDGLFSAQTDGRYHRHACPFYPSMTQLKVARTLENPIFLATTPDGMRRCDDADGIWTKLDADDAVGCRAHEITRKNQTICSPTQCLELDLQAQITAMACNSSWIYLATDDPLIYRLSQTQFKSPEIFAGNGLGVVDQAPIQDAKIGIDLGKMAVDNFPRLYFWMRDTCSIWRIPVWDELEGTTPITRLFTDEKLCTASAFDVTRMGEMAFVHDRTLYTLSEEKMTKVAEFQDEVIDMTHVGYGFAILALDGVYTWENGVLSKKADNPIFLDGHWIDYAVPADVTPRIVQSPNENAVLIPVFGEDAILRIAL